MDKNTQNLLTKIKNCLQEAINLADFSDPAIQKKLSGRKQEVIRLANLAKESANKARKQNKLAEAEKLDALAQELSEIAASGKFNIANNAESQGSSKAKANTSDGRNGNGSDDGTEDDDAEQKDESDENEDEKLDGDPGNPDDTESDSENKEAKDESETTSGDDSGEEAGDKSEDKDESGEESENESEEESENESEDDSENESENGAEGGATGKPNQSKTELDPFADQNEISLANNKMQISADQVTKDDILKAAAKILKRLKNDGRAGAIAGLQDVLNTKKSTTVESLSESYIDRIKKQSIDELNDDEYADFVNDVLDDINKLTPITIKDPRSKDDLDSLVKDLEKPLFKRGIDIEDNIELQKDFQKQKAQTSELTKYQHYKPISQFKPNLYYAILNQVTTYEDEEESYTAIERKLEDPTVIKPGIYIDDKLDDKKPSIDFYFDMSGSWTGDEKAMEIGKRAVATLKEFVDRDELDLNIYYFSDANYDGFATNADDARLGHNTNSWSAILNNIKANKAKNVVVMTDLDMDDQAKTNGNCVVDGCVWFIWNTSQYSRGSEAMVKHLQGKQGTFQYSFNHNTSN